MGMTVIDGPRIQVYDGGVELDKWGLTGIVTIAESHLAIHTFPGYRFVQVDLSSCRAFDVAKLTLAVRRDLELASVEVHVVERGLHRALERGAIRLVR
jgi:S-adenosylmethionine decarboxylase